MNIRKMTREVRLRHWAGLINEKNANKTTIKEFCAMHSISPKTYYYWQRKLREAAMCQMTEPTSGFIQTGLVPTGFTEVKASKALKPADAESIGKIHIEAAGLQLTADSAYPSVNLAELIRELARLC
jgi:transposase-like protein